jgi:hypothetical protein
MDEAQWEARLSVVATRFDTSWKRTRWGSLA